MTFLILMQNSLPSFLQRFSVPKVSCRYLPHHVGESRPRLNAYNFHTVRSKLLGARVRPHIQPALCCSVCRKNRWRNDRIEAGDVEDDARFVLDHFGTEVPRQAHGRSEIYGNALARCTRTHKKHRKDLDTEEEWDNMLLAPNYDLPAIRAQATQQWKVDGHVRDQAEWKVDSQTQEKLPGKTIVVILRDISIVGC